MFFCTAIFLFTFCINEEQMKLNLSSCDLEWSGSIWDKVNNCLLLCYLDIQRITSCNIFFFWIDRWTTSQSIIMNNLNGFCKGKIWPSHEITCQGNCKHTKRNVIHKTSIYIDIFEISKMFFMRWSCLYWKQLFCLTPLWSWY